MKVAYLVNQYPRNTHSFIRREIQALERLGVEVVRYSQRPCHEPLATEADRRELERTRIVLGAGVHGHAIAIAQAVLAHPIRFWRALVAALRLGSQSDSGLVRHIVYLAEACVLARWLRDDPVDHLHAHFGTNSATIATLCSMLGGTSFSFTVHGPNEFDRPEFLKLGKKIESAAFTVAISSFGRSQLYRWARPEDWSKIEVVRCGVEPELLAAPPTPVPDVSKFVCVGRLGNAKGHLLLVEAAARVAAKGIPFEIVLAGDGPMRDAIEAAIRRSHLEDRIKLTGWMSAEQVRVAILGSRALLLPSFAEGLPVILMEALALHRPVVTTAIAGTPELVRPGVHGWLIPPGSVGALADAMVEVLATPTQRLTEMGRAGAAAVAAQHDSLSEARKLQALFAKSAPPG